MIGFGERREVTHLSKEYLSFVMDSIDRCKSH